MRIACLACLAGAQKKRKRPQRARVQRANSRSTVVAGVELQAELDRYSRLPVFGGDASRLAERPAQLHIRRAQQMPRRRLAFASYDRHLIHLTAWPGQTRAEALETLLHEVVHLQSLDLARHDIRFKRTLAQAAFEAWGVDLRHRVRQAVYALDVEIRDALAASLSASTPSRPCP